MDQIQHLISRLVDIGNYTLFFNINFWSEQYKIPFLIGWLLFAGVFFCIRFRFISITHIFHSIYYLCSPTFNKKQIELKKIEGQDYETTRKIILFNIGSGVDIGSIAGVATIVAIVGPGVIFWIIIAGFVSASIRFVEVVAGHLYRIRLHDGHISGGPQYYIRNAFDRLKLPQLGKIVSIIFSSCLLLSTLCSLQFNQTVHTIVYFIPEIKNYTWIVALSCATFVTVLLFFGFKHIIVVTSKIVPMMSKLYLLATFAIVYANIDNLGPTIKLIFHDALRPISGVAGCITAIIIGKQRAFFCSEAGMGSSAITHASTINPNAISEGIASMISPIIISVIICVCSGLISTITGSYLKYTDGVSIIAHAFGTFHPSFPLLLLFIVPMFGLSTAIAWAYYGQTTWRYLFNKETVFIYNILLFVAYIISGSVDDFLIILNLADILNLSLTIPNIVALYLLSNVVGRKLSEYKKTRSFE